MTSPPRSDKASYFTSSSASVRELRETSRIFVPPYEFFWSVALRTDLPRQQQKFRVLSKTNLLPSKDESDAEKEWRRTRAKPQKPWEKKE